LERVIKDILMKEFLIEVGRRILSFLIKGLNLRESIVRDVLLELLNSLPKEAVNLPRDSRELESA